MSPTLQTPPGFIDLAEAYSRPQDPIVNIMGVVVDHMPEKKTTKDWMMTFRLLDPKLRDSMSGAQGLGVRIFRKDPILFPKVRNIGDVVLIRGVILSPFGGTVWAISSRPTPIVVFPSTAIPGPAFSIAYQDKNRVEMHGNTDKVSLLEQKYAIDLHGEMLSTIKDVAGQAETRVSKQPAADSAPPLAPTRMGNRPSPFGNKFRRIREIGNAHFADICGEVVKLFPTHWGCELYITDYTENRLMWRYPDPKEDGQENRDGDEYSYTSRPQRQFPGPYGWLTLKVNVKHPHAQVARELEEGTFILLRNVKCKIQNDGAKLEGDMWPDDRNLEKVNVAKLTENQREFPDVYEMLERKEKYWEARAKRYPEKHQLETESDKPLSKTEIKRRKKAARQKENKKKTAEIDPSNMNTLAKDPTMNPHIRCAYDEIPTLSLRTILDPDNNRHVVNSPKTEAYTIPFVNAKYRARVRVVDFEPKALEDFTYLTMPDDDKSVYSADMDWSSSAKWQWFFSLLLEDASPSRPKKGTEREKQWVHVSHEDAQFLFGNDMADPVDLRQDPQVLAKLKEKLFILWGNLEEKVANEVLSNRPFECCLMEYGVELDEDDLEVQTARFGYKRMFRIFQTNIM